MKEDKLREIALFRYSLIAPIVTDTYQNGSKLDYFRLVASKSHVLPGGKEAEYAPGTIKSWYHDYLNGGFDALIPKSRSDIGVPRSLSNLAITRINALKESHPHITGTLIYHKLIEEGTINKSEVSLSSILRYIKFHNLKTKQLVGTERKAFEMEYANDCWQSDTSHGPYIMIDGKNRKTYLIMIIDDASRLIVGAKFFLFDNGTNMQLVLKQAVSKYGVPKRLFVDNGKTYKNHQLSMICASIGTVLIHSKPYSPQSKGKIERCFRTIKDKWMHGLDYNEYHSLEELDISLSRFISQQYNNKVHSSINQTPRDRFITDQNKIKYIHNEELDNHFLHRETRKVANDSTIKINKIQFEVPQKYIGQRINIRFYPGDLSKGYIFDNDDIVEICPLNKTDNSKIKRNTIDFSKLNGGS